MNIKLQKQHLQYSLTIIIKGSMSHEKSKWKKLGSKSGTKSYLSKDSGKFNPKKSNKLENDRQVVTISQLKITQSQNLQPESLSVKELRPIVKTTSNLEKANTLLNIEDQGIDDNIFQPSSLRTPTKSIQSQQSAKEDQQKKQNSHEYFKSVQMEIKASDSIQQKFKKCLRYMERIEKQYLDHRVSIENEFLAKHQEIKEVKSFILQSYMRKVNQDDPETKKMFEKFRYDKHVRTPRQLVRVRSSETLKPSFYGGTDKSFIKIEERERNILQNRVEHSMANGKNSIKIDKQNRSIKQKNLKHSMASDKSQRSKASQTCKQKFTKILQTLQSMKKDLHYSETNNKH